MDTLAVLLREPEQLELSRLALSPPSASDIIVDIRWSGISSGTERLLWSGQMPPFPGMGYPLVPGYESVGVVAQAGPDSGRRVGEQVFVPGARCFGPVRGLFGGAARRLVTGGDRVTLLPEGLDRDGVLLALAATAQHALAGGPLPELVVGHGVLGRLLARIIRAQGGAPTVWETNPARADAADYPVLHPDTDTRRDYKGVIDASGDANILDTLVGRIARGAEIILAGFYHERLNFAFPPAFMKEARIRIAAEWKQPDIATVNALLASGALRLDGLITHQAAPMDATAAYRTAFTDPACLKMVLDWRHTA